MQCSYRISAAIEENENRWFTEGSQCSVVTKQRLLQEARARRDSNWSFFTPFGIFTLFETHCECNFLPAVYHVDAVLGEVSLMYPSPARRLTKVPGVLLLLDSAHM